MLCVRVPGWAWACVVVLVMGGRWAAAGVCVAEGESNVYKLEGDAVITLLLALHTGPHCDQASLTEVQVMEATRLAVQTVNSLNLLGAIKLGLRVVETCGHPEFSLKMALAAWSTDALTCPQPALSLAFLGPGDVASAAAVGAGTRALGVPVLAYGPRPSSAPPTLDLLTPAPQRTAQAAVHVLSNAGVDAISVVHTADVEGRALAELFISTAEYVYICVEVVLEDSADVSGMINKLQAGPGTVVILGTRPGVQNLASTLGVAGGPVELLLLVDTGGPVPNLELASLEVPALILQRTVPELPEFVSFLKRDLESEDDPRQEYMAALSECEVCSETDYDAAASASIAAVLALTEALQKAQEVYCGSGDVLCRNVSSLDTSAWEDLISGAGVQTLAATTFPSLVETLQGPGSEDQPRYNVKLLTLDGLTQVGQADESSGVLGQLDLELPRCGAICPCILPEPEEPESPILPPATNSSDDDEFDYDESSGFGVFSGVDWWEFELPDPRKMSKAEMVTYVTAFGLIVSLSFCGSMIFCAYRMNAPRRRD